MEKKYRDNFICNSYTIYSDMNIGLAMLIVLLSICLLVIYKLIMTEDNCNINEHMINISPDIKPSWNRNKCKFYMNDTLKNVLKNNNIKQSDKWNVYFPCGYDDISKEIESMPEKDGAKYFIINNADNMTAKEWLWQYVVKHHGFAKAKTMMPTTYVLSNQIDFNELKTNYREGNLYIMKKNVQRQEGLKITNKLSDLANGKKDGYVIAQELLQNPYTIDGRKTNMRFYVLVVCKDDDTNVYVHNNGFMYYTRDKFIKGSTEVGPNITTGYIDRQVYIDNPLTHEDLRLYLDKERELNKIEQNVREQGMKISNVYFGKIYQLIREVFTSFLGRICGGKKLKTNVTFQLFGIDIGVDENLNPMIMEINKGPDMGAKDKRDSDVKHGVIADMMNIIGAVSDRRSNGFINIIEFENGTLRI